MSEDKNDDKTQTHLVITNETVIDHYRIIDKIGSGGMGDVYLAEDTKLKRKVALKFLSSNMCQDENLLTRFKREAQSIAQLDHPNIITVHEVSEYKSRPFFVMQFVQPRSLKDYSQDKNPSINQIIKIMIDISDGLQTAHQNNIIHRDIKPSNILIDESDRPKIVDFGLATIKGMSQLTEIGTTMGTTQYMSPERIKGEQGDARSDLFSLGILFYELLSGELPFKGENPQAVMHSILNKEIDPLKDNVPDQIRIIVSKLLCKDPEDRFQSGNELSNALQLVLTSPSGETVTVIKPVSRKKNYFKLIISALIVVIAIISYIYVINSSTETDITPKDQKSIMEQWDNSIAVLPFNDFSTNQDQSAFCDGIMFEIIRRLGSYKNLKVPSANSVLRYKNRELDVEKFGKELKVSHLLVGGIRKTDNSVSGEVRLWQVEDGNELWSYNFDDSIGFSGSIQDTISQAIADQLKIELLGFDGQQDRDYTSNADAFQLYTQGRVYMIKKDIKHLDQAEEFFNQVIEMDSTYVPAYSGLIDLFNLKNEIIIYQNRLDDTNYELNRERALEIEKIAIIIDSNNTELQASMGLNDFNQYKFDEAEEHFKKSIEINPNYFPAHKRYAKLLLHMNRRDDSHKELEIAYNLDPLDMETIVTLIKAKARFEEWDAVEELYQHALEIDPNDPDPLIAYAAGKLRYGQGKIDVTGLDTLFDVAISYDSLKVKDVAYAYISLGDTAKSFDYLGDYIKRNPSDYNMYETRGIINYLCCRYDSVISDCKIILENDSLNQSALYYISLAYLYNDDLGNLETAIQDYKNRYPDVSTPYMLLGLAYYHIGNFDKAIPNLNQSARLNPSLVTRMVLGSILLHRRQFVLVENSLAGFMMTDDPEQLSFMSNINAMVQLYQGRIDTALIILNQGTKNDSINQDFAHEAFKHTLIAQIYEIKGENNLALEEIQKFYNLVRRTNLFEKSCGSPLLCYYLALNNKFDEAEEELEIIKDCMEDEIIPLIKQDIEKQYYFAKGSIELFKKNYRKAADNFTISEYSPIIKVTQSPVEFNRYTMMLSGIAYYKTNQIEKAIGVFETLLTTYSVDDLDHPVLMVEMHYYLGLAYEKSGRIEKAIQKYEDFLDIWRDADESLKSLQDAKERLAFLKGKT